MKSGFVAVLGRPSVGKSTLVNALVGKKVSITSKRPGTTRNRVLGVMHLQDAQAVLVDTPGVQTPRDALTRLLLRTSLGAMGDADVVLHVVDASEAPGPGDRRLAHQITPPSVLVLNKIDQVAKGDLQTQIRSYRSLHAYSTDVAVSALTGEGLTSLQTAVSRLLPEGPPYFPEGQLTDRSEDWLSSEIIREAMLHELRDEVPHAAAVVMEQFEADGDLMRLAATIFVEREAQKAIVIGRRGARLKAIGTLARQELEVVLGAHVFLQLWVKVREDWRQRPGLFRSLGFDEDHP